MTGESDAIAVGRRPQPGGRPSAPGRLAVVQDRQREIQVVRNNELVGQTFEVLVDGASRRPGQWAGRTSSNRILNFSSPHSDLLGQYIQVRVTGASPNSLIGEQVISEQVV